MLPENITIFLINKAGTAQMGLEQHPGRVRLQIIKIGKRTKRSVWPDRGLKSTG